MGYLVLVAMLFFAAAMTRRQMGVASDIVNLAFTVLLGAIAVAVALAFGLGGREIAARELENWVSELRGGGGGEATGAGRQTSRLVR